MVDLYPGQLALAPNGNLVAAHSDRETVQVWNSTTGKELHKFQIDKRDDVTAVAISPVATIAIASSKIDRSIRIDTTILVANAVTGEEIRMFRCPSEEKDTALAFSPDASVLALAAGDWWIRLFNVATDTEERRIDIGFPIYAEHLRFSTDGRLIYTERSRYETGLGASSSPLLQHPPHIPPIDIYNWWIRLQGEEILWVPHLFRGTSSAVFEKTLAIGQQFAEMSIFKSR